MTTRVTSLFVVLLACIAAVLAVIAALSLGIGEPWLMPSPVACVCLRVLLPDTPAARPWAVAVGQLVGLAAVWHGRSPASQCMS